MFKSRSASLIFAMMCVITVTGYAADPFSFQPTPANAPPQNTKRPPPLSSGEFKSKVTEANKQARRDSQQQSQSTLKQQESQLPLPTPPASTSSQETNSSTPPPAKRAKPSLPPASEHNEVAPVAPTTAAPKPEAEPPPAQSQVYTGFGAGSPGTGTGTGTTPAPPPPPASGGGWKVY